MGYVLTADENRAFDWERTGYGIPGSGQYTAGGVPVGGTGISSNLINPFLPGQVDQGKGGAGGPGGGGAKAQLAAMTAADLWWLLPEMERRRLLAERGGVLENPYSAAFAARQLKG